jgi:putative oxidoreductase
MPEYLALVARFALGTLFVFAGAAKLGSIQDFEAVVRAHRLLPAGLARQVAQALAWLEIGLGLLLLIGEQVDKAAYGLIFLLVLFMLVIARILARRERLRCGCFGSESNGFVGPAALVRNVVLLVLASIVAKYQPSALSVQTSQTGVEISDSDAIALFVMTLAALVGLRLLVSAFLIARRVRHLRGLMLR